MDDHPTAAAVARAAARRAADHLATDARVRLVTLFGSTTDPARGTVRDVDLALRADPPLSPDEVLALRADLVTLTQCPIDLVDLDEASVVLAWEIADTGECLFSRTPDDELNFVLRARTRYWDFKPYLAEQWRLAGERLEERKRGPAS